MNVDLLDTENPDAQSADAADTAPESPPEGLDAMLDQAMADYPDIEDAPEEPVEDTPEADEPETPDETPPEPEPEAPKGEGKSTFIPEEQFKTLPKNVQDRIRTLDRQKREATQQVETLRGEADTYRQSHERVENLDRFMDQNNLAGEEFVSLLEFAAVFKGGDFKRAAEIIRPIMDQINLATGETLPADLREMVEAGEMTAEAAKRAAEMQGRMTSAEIHARNAAARAERLEAERQQQTLSDQQQRQIAALRQATSAEVAAITAEDKSFDTQMQTRVAEEIGRMRNELGVQFTTEAQARSAVRLAYQVVKARTAPLAATAPRPGSPTNPRPANRQPRTAEEAAEIAISQWLGQ